MRPQGTPQQLEKRRRQAIQLFKSGKHLSAISRWLGASKSSVCRWFQSYQKSGFQGLKPKPIPGRPCKLRRASKRRLATLLVKGPLACGYTTDLWTLERITHLIGQEFHVQYHPNHVWRLLLSMGFSCQKPERRALQRNEQRIAHWKRYQWPHIKKR